MKIRTKILTKSTKSTVLNLNFCPSKCKPQINEIRRNDDIEIDIRRKGNKIMLIIDENRRKPTKTDENQQKPTKTDENRRKPTKIDKIDKTSKYAKESIFDKHPQKCAKMFTNLNFSAVFIARKAIIILCRCPIMNFLV